MAEDSDIRRREVIVSQSVIEGWQNRLKRTIHEIERLGREKKSLENLIEAGQLVLMNSELELIRERSEREARERTEAAVRSVEGWDRAPTEAELEQRSPGL